MARARFTRFRIGGGIRIVWALLSALGLVFTLAACSASGGAAPSATVTPGSSGTAGGTTGGPRLAFKESEHDFGPISYSTPMEYRFALTNTGDAPLQIGDIRAEPIDPASCA